MRHFFYLHGFASSAKSKKAAYIARRLREQQCDLHCPDFNEPDFSTLTITRMVEQVERAVASLPHGPVTLFGSSLGGFVAVHVAARQAAGKRPGEAVGAAAHGGRAWIDRLVLLAPALDFARTRMKQLGEEAVGRWRQAGRLDVYHHGFNAVIPVHFALYEDAQEYDALSAHVPMPMLIFQGRRDDAVDPAMVARFAGTRSNAALRLLDDDHQLMGSLDVIWEESARFLGLAPPRRRE